MDLVKREVHYLCLDFIKINTKVISSKKSLSRISHNLKTLTDAEGLPNHYNAVGGRLE